MNAPTPPLLPSQIESIGDLRVLRKVGAGRTSEVFCVQDHTGMFLALKKKNRSGMFTTSDWGSSEPFENEAEILSRLLQVSATETVDDKQIAALIPRIHFFDGQHIVTDFHKNGDLLDYIALGSSLFDEDLARYFFV